MKKLSLVAGVAVVVIGMNLLVNAVERHFAARDTAQALEVIESGVDWDGVTPISSTEQADRMDANVAV